MGLSFSEALVHARHGKKIAREGWNGKGMFVLLAGDYSIPKDKLREGTLITPEFLESRGCDEMVILPHLDMWTADNKYLTGWLASQSDMLALDWYVEE